MRVLQREEGTRLETQVGQQACVPNALSPDEQLECIPLSIRLGYDLEYPPVISLPEGAHHPVLAVEQVLP
jgi:hypothetical protein